MHAIRLALEPKTPVVPKWAGGTGTTSSALRRERQHLSDSEGDSDEDSEVGIPHAPLRQSAPTPTITIAIDWEETWKRVEQIPLPGLAKETWWLVLIEKCRY